MVEIKPLKPIMTEEELDVEFDKEDVRIFDIDRPIEYQVVVSGLDENKEENGFYWRSNIFQNKDDAIALACLIEKDKFREIIQKSHTFLVEVIEVCDDEDIETIFSIDFIN